MNCSTITDTNLCHRSEIFGPTCGRSHSPLDERTASAVQVDTATVPGMLVAGLMSPLGMVEVLQRYAALLVANEAQLNEMNVFPLADRDTGTNLVRTVERLIRELDSVGDSQTIGSRAAVAALAAARGNSGLILSQYLAGFLGSVGGATEVDRGTEPACHSDLDLEKGADSFAMALAAGAADARAAVADPVEGTILSVADRVAAIVAESDIVDPACLGVLAHRASMVALAATPDQLDVLARAGVVDAGGAGLVLFFQALTEHMSGTAGPAVPVPVPASVPVVSGTDGLLGFELQFTAHGPRPMAEELRVLLNRFGRDVVVSWAEDVARAHVHLDEVGPALEAVLDVTRPRDIMVEPLREVT